MRNERRIFPAVEAHSDIGIDVLLRRRLGERHVLDKRHYERLRAGGIALQVAAVYVEARDKPQWALENTLLQLEALLADLEESKGFYPVLSRGDLELFGADDRIGVLLMVEGGEFLDAGIEMLHLARRLGVRMLGLTWNQRNALASGIDDADSGGGLTAYGRTVVTELFRLGMLLDVSHLSHAGVRDVLQCAPGIVVASHAGAKSVYDCPRNLSDEEIQGIARRGGVVGVPAFPFLLSKEWPSIETVTDHVEMIIKIAGENHVGIGADFVDFFGELVEGGQMGHEWIVPQELRTAGFVTAADLPNLSDCLLRRGWGEDVVAKVMGGNFLRAFARSLPPG